MTESVADASGARIKAIMQASFNAMKAITSRGDIGQERMLKELGEHFTASQKTLIKIANEDARADEAVQHLSTVYAAFVRGENPVLNLNI